MAFPPYADLLRLDSYLHAQGPSKAERPDEAKLLYDRAVFFSEFNLVQSNPPREMEAL